MTEKSKKELEHRLNRVIGQIEGIKKRINTDSTDCVQTMQQLKAVTRALKKFGESYVNEHIDLCIKKKNTSDMRNQLKDAINSAFNI